MPRKAKPVDFYAGHDPAEMPAYYLAEAAAYLQVPASTIRNWVLGVPHRKNGKIHRSRPFVTPADPQGNKLSFLNLVELHVVNAIRRYHAVRPKKLLRAIDYLKETFDTDHPLISQQMFTDDQSLFIERFGQYADISAQGQLCIKKMLNAYMKRIERSNDGIPIRLFPFTRKAIETSPELVAINPRVRSGKPCIAGTGIPTRIIAQRYQAGDSISILKRDYGRPESEIEEAIRYESRAAS